MLDIFATILFGLQTVFVSTTMPFEWLPVVEIGQTVTISFENEYTFCK